MKETEQAELAAILGGGYSDEEVAELLERFIQDHCSETTKIELTEAQKKSLTAGVGFIDSFTIRDR